MNTIQDILHKIQKPGRYIGEETNSVRKGFSPDRTSVLIAYPDSYEVGMSYLGLRLLYHLLNEQEKIVCERVFMPWEDMRGELIENRLKLFSLESRTDMDKFDIVGFSLSYELTYTNVLDMLSLGGVTVLSKDRGNEEPLVIAGGACASNPEPMSAFVDAFLIGDAEEALPVFIEAYRKAKERTDDRNEILKELSLLEGVYVPRFYRAIQAEGKFMGLEAVEDGIPDKIRKVSIASLENAYYPEKQIVPLVRVVHDRIAVEIMRGCPNRCRFCQAGIVNRPVRVRTPERVRDICRKTYELTGYESIALLSLSSVNYPRLAELIKALNKDFSGEGVALSIPSLRVDEAFYELPEMISAIRKTGLTFAPEAASGEVREAIGKKIDTQVLCKSASLAFSHGWRRLKLYFMVGFPGEPEDEAGKIVALGKEISALKKKVSSGGAAEIRVSVNPFIPKPHTPLQWIGMKDPEGMSRTKDVLRSGSSKKVKVEFHDLDQALLEACISRGGREISDIIYRAWQKGARMDGWNESFNINIWKEAFDSEGVDMTEYACRTYSKEDVLPWDHIIVEVDKEYLLSELEASGLYDK
ncbi:MAG: TIGR03960 family B12-binding radical SAM protein [Candidatus Tantalella remota]|nr:TIGR03960 family B12-binding radical SAM protein [Candidatus Tantalella remota]